MSEFMTRGARDAPWMASYLYPNNPRAVPQNRPANVQAPVNQMQAPVNQLQAPVNQLQAAPVNRGGRMEEEEFVLPPEQERIEIEGESFETRTLGDIVQHFENGGAEAVIAQQAAILKELEAQKAAQEAQNNALRNRPGPLPVQQQAQAAQGVSQGQNNPRQGQRQPPQPGFQNFPRPEYRPPPPTGPRPGPQGGSQPGPQGGSQPIRQASSQPRSQGRPLNSPIFNPKPLSTERLQRVLGSVGLTPQQVTGIIYDRGLVFATWFVRDRYSVPRLRYEIQRLSPERFASIMRSGRFEWSHPHQIADALTILRVNEEAWRAKPEDQKKVLENGTKAMTLEKEGVVAVILEIMNRMKRMGIEVKEYGQSGPVSPMAPFRFQPPTQPPPQPQPVSQNMQEVQDNIPAAEPESEESQTAAELSPEQWNEFTLNLMTDEVLPAQQENPAADIGNNLQQPQVQGDMEEELAIGNINPVSEGLQTEAEQVAVNPEAGEIEQEAPVSPLGEGLDYSDIRVLERIPSNILPSSQNNAEAAEQAVDQIGDQIPAVPADENNYVPDEAELQDVIRGFANWVDQMQGTAPLEEYAPNENPDVQVFDPALQPPPAEENSRPQRVRLKKLEDVIRGARDNINNMSEQVSELEPQPVPDSNFPPEVKVVRRKKVGDVISGARDQIRRLVTSHNDRQDIWDSRSNVAPSLNRQGSQVESDLTVEDEAIDEISEGAQESSESEGGAKPNRLNVGSDESSVYAFFTPNGSPADERNVEIEDTFAEEYLEDYPVDEDGYLEEEEEEASSPENPSVGSDWDSDNPDDLTFNSNRVLSQEERERQNAERRELNRRRRERRREQEVQERRQQDYVSTRSRISRPSRPSRQAARIARTNNRNIANSYRRNPNTNGVTK
ncbi:hypothetical protein AA313_de0206320 [Arthrobotrys entomopaga]|nr:hypothetical protein AA313_de0206320 [Arthrobotrys entomopaga]